MPLHASASVPAVRPLLKWAGGKRQLLDALVAHCPRAFNRYVEPFVGSGALFFHLFSTGRLDGRCVLLADVNPDLIGCYRTLRDRTDEVIRALEALEVEHRRGGDACYYDVRDRRFNPMRAELPDRAATSGYPPTLAAMLIFLNRTGFNGLFRLNRSGAFNVPAGRYTKPRICDPDHLRDVARALAAGDIAIELQPFDVTLDEAGAGDFVYCDPPYAPLSATSSFASYTADGFTAFDQQRLQQAVMRACLRGAHVVVSNSSAPEIESMYSCREARAAGLRIHRVPARRAINSRGSGRGCVDELVVTNAAAAAAAALPMRLRMAQARSRQKRRSA